MRPVLLVLMWILLAPALPSRAAEPAILWLGVVRADRTIVPFARFDGSSWSNPWPAGMHIDSKNPPDSTLTFDRIPQELHAPLPRMPREWHAQRAQGSFTTVMVTRPVFVYSWCETFLALLFGNASFPVNTHKEVTLEGFAASAPIQTDPLLRIEKNSTEWARLLGLIRPAFDKSEEDHRHPLSPDTRAKAEFSVERLVRGQSGPDGRTVAYFEVERDYAKTGQLPARSEFSRSFMTGWIVTDRTGMPSFIEKTFRNKSDTDDIIVGKLNPLGTATVGGNNIWIVQFRGYEGESYSVLHVTPTGIRKLLVAHGGGC